MIFNLILIALDAYLSFSGYWTASLESPALAWAGIAMVQLVFLSQLWLYFMFFKSSAETKIRFEKPLQAFAFFGMGLISFLFTFTLTRDVAAIFIPHLYGTQATLWITGLSFGAFIAGAVNARFRIISPTVQVPIAGLPESLVGLRIVQLSDVHLGTGPKTKHVTAMVDRALSLKPDIIALTGDIIDGNVPDIQAELRELARLKAPHGVYFVIGNHECYWNHRESIDAMKSGGAIALENSGVTVNIKGEKIFVAGVNDPAVVHIQDGKYKGDAPKIPIASPDSVFNLLLVHQPQLAKLVLNSGQNYHLQLSGHTHGGQFFPWNLAVRFMYPIHKGLGRIQDLWVYVSSGTGYWGPPIRLGTDGEVTNIVLSRYMEKTRIGSQA